MKVIQREDEGTVVGGAWCVVQIRSMKVQLINLRAACQCAAILHLPAERTGSLQDN